MVVLALGPGALTSIVLAVLVVLIVIGWRSLRTQVRHIDKLPSDEPSSRVDLAEK